MFHNIKCFDLNILGGFYLEYVPHDDLAPQTCQGRYSYFKGAGGSAKAEAVDACKKDDLCMGIRGDLEIPSLPPGEDIITLCKDKVEIFYLCKSLVPINQPRNAKECLWEKVRGGYIGKRENQDFYSKNKLKHKIHTIHLKWPIENMKIRY